MSEQMGLMLETEVQAEDVKDVLKILTVPCNNCKLSLLHETNRGLLARGNPNAYFAVLVDYPGDTDMDNGVPMVGERGHIFDKWLRFLNVDSRNQVFIMPLVQCQPPRERIKKGKRMVWGKQLEPTSSDIDACFPARAMRVLKAMPNLKAIMTLGWLSAEAVLGKSWDEEQKKFKPPSPKSHEGNWYFTTKFPGVAVFCAPRIEDFVGKADPARKGWLQICLTNFKREFLEQRKVQRLAQEENKRYERDRF